MAGQPVIAGNAPAGNQADLAMMLQGYSPQTAMAAQHSQYLAQALAAMQSQGQNIRTPVALGANLLADALLQRRYGQSMQDFAQAARSDQGEMFAPIVKGLEGLRGSLAGGSPAGPAPSAAASAPDDPVPPPPPPPTPQNTAPAPAPAGPSPIVLRAVLGEAGGNPEGQKAVYASILKRAQESGLTPEQVVTAPGQYEGLNAPWMAREKNLTPYLERTAANIAGVQAGPYDSFYSPTGQAALGRGAPAWAQGPGVNIGGNAFYETGYKAPAGMTPARATTPGGAPAYAPEGNPGPLQVSSAPQSTPTPSPSPSASGVPAPGGPAGAPPAAASPAAGGASPPGFTNRPYIDPRRIDYVEAELKSPMTRMQGLQDARALVSEGMSPDQWDVKSDPTTGQTVYSSKTRPGVSFAMDTQGVRVNPTASIQGDKIVSYDPRDPAHPTITQTGLPTERKAMMMSDGRGGYVNVPGPMTDSERGAYLGLRNDFYNAKPNEEYEKTANALNAVNDMLAHATKNNGVLDMGVMDNLIQAQTGLSAKQGNVQLLLSHLGVPQEFLGRVSNLFGNGPITPEVIQQMRSVLRSYATQQAAGAQHRLDQQNAVSKAQGFGDLGITLLPLSPDVRFSFQPAPAPGAAPARPGVSSASEFQ